MSDTYGIDVEYLQGIHVVDTVLWLDALRRADLCFLSHAHVDPVDPHRKVLATEATSALAQSRMRGAQILMTPYGRRFTLGELDLELHPSGHMLGAAQLSATRGEVRLVYTGDYSLDPARTAAPAGVLACDVLVLVANYGQPHHVLPDRRGVEHDLSAWARSELQHDRHPVVIVPPLGKAQELVALFQETELTVRAHESIYRACRTYERFGIRLPGVRLFRGSVRSNEVLLMPPRPDHARSLQRLGALTTAVVTGSSMEAGAAQRFGVDRAFPYSMQADRPALLRYVHESGASKVYVVGRAASAFAGELRRQGVNAWPLLPPEQMDLFRRRHAAN